MTAPARNVAPQQRQPQATPIVDVSLIDKVIEETLRAKDSRARIETYLPRGIDFESVMADVYLAGRKNPDLLKCDRASLVDAVIEVQQRGLRIGSTCHLVPKGGKVLAWNDIRGDVEMIIRSGACRDITPNVVYANEPFTLVETATGPDMRHEIIDDAGSRGEAKGAYARFWLGGNRYMVKYMPLADIEIVRAGSLTWNPTKVKKCPPWYMLKTVIRQGAKYLPKNRKMLAVYATFDRDADVDTVIPALPEFVREPGGETVRTETGEIIDQPTLTLEQALVYPFPFRPGTKLHNRPLGEVSTETLTSVAHWIVEQQDAKGDETWQAEALAAMNLVVISRENATATAAPVEQQEQPPIAELGLEPEPEDPAPGSTSMVMPAPGRVADALPPRTPVLSPREASREIPQVKLPF